MKFTREKAARFSGGMIQVRNDSIGYVYWAKIHTCALALPDSLIVKCSEAVEKISKIGKKSEWQPTDKMKFYYIFDLKVCRTTNLGPHPRYAELGNRWKFTNLITRTRHWFFRLDA